MAIRTSGSVIGVLGETWAQVDQALRERLRGLPDGRSLAQLLAQERGKRHIQQLPPLQEEQILAWADAHFQRTGQWPTCKSGHIPDSPKEKWRAVDLALRKGVRGLPGGSSLARLLAAHRGVRNRTALPQLSEEQILVWADAHQQRTGSWPTNDSGAVLDAPGAACPAARPWPNSWPGAAGPATSSACRRWGSSRSWPGRTPTTMRPVNGRRELRGR